VKAYRQATKTSQDMLQLLTRCSMWVSHQDAAAIRMLLQSVKGSHFTLNHIECCKHVSYHETFQVLHTTGSGPALRMTVCDVYVPAGWLQSVFKLSQGMESQSKKITHKV